MASRKPGKWAVEFRNLREVKAAFQAISRSVEGRAGSGIIQSASKAVQEGYIKASGLIRDRARSNAQQGGAPRRLYAGPRPAIFGFSDFGASADKRKSRSAMVGVRTGLSSRTPDPNLFIRWGRGAARRKGGSIATKGLSMSFGRLFESGTKDRRVKPLRYFRSAIFQTRGNVIAILTKAYQSAAAAINAFKTT